MRYLEDFAVGQITKGGEVTVTAEAIITFARQFDPQPFHLDDEAARQTLFGGLAASGWHTAAMTMSMLIADPDGPANGFIGLGVEDIRWPIPTRPGDRLSIENEVLDVRPSQSKPETGILTVRTTTLNQNDKPVQIMTSKLLVVRRPVNG